MRRLDFNAVDVTEAACTDNFVFGKRKNSLRRKYFCEDVIGEYGSSEMPLSFIELSGYCMVFEYGVQRALVKGKCVIELQILTSIMLEEVADGLSMADVD